MEEDFKSAGTHNIRRLRDYLRKFGVWIRKQERYNIARALYEALLEEVPIQAVPTDWTEEELMKCEDKENFASFRITRLFESDFGKKPENLSPYHHQQPLTPSSRALFASPSPTPGPSAPAPVHTLIYPIQPPGTGPTPGEYMQPSGPHQQLTYSFRAQNLHQQLTLRRAQDPHLPLTHMLQI